MPRYVTSLRADAQLAHIGYPVTTCGEIFPGAHRVSDHMPPDRRICPECVDRATGFGWLTADEADVLRAITPARRDVAALMVSWLLDGASDREMAHRLGVSMRSINRYVSAAMQKAGAHTRFQWGYVVGIAARSQLS